MSEQNNKPLLPCPWCGGTSIYVSVAEICCPVQYSANAKCRDCGGEEPQGSGVCDERADAETEAIEQWNTRAASPAERQIAAIREAMQESKRSICDLDPDSEIYEDLYFDLLLRLDNKIEKILEEGNG